MITALQIVFLITFFVFQTQFISKYCRKHALYYLLLIIFSLIAFQFVQNGQIFALSVAFIPLILSFSVEILSFYIQKHRLQQSFLNFLDKMILKMQNGTSFQVTLSEIYLESDAFLQQKPSCMTTLCCLEHKT